MKSNKVLKKNFQKTGTNHITFYEYDEYGIAQPFPTKTEEKWDSDHVRLPSNPLNFSEIKNELNLSKLKPSWKIIQSSLSKPIKDVFGLKDVILSYNNKFEEVWNFEILIKLFTQILNRKQTESFFNLVLPKMVQLVLNTPNYITQPIPLLKRGHNKSLSFSALQIACLLSNSFFCTFPRRNFYSKNQFNNSEYSDFPKINFNNLYCEDSKDRSGKSRKIEKLKCLIHYFTQISISLTEASNQNEKPASYSSCCHDLNRIVTYTRNILDSKPDWFNSNQSISSISINLDGTDMFTADHNYIKVDFANCLMGGGVLNHGCVQEEILLVVYPELLIGLLFMERMEDEESIVVIGPAHFNAHYNGYADSFRYQGDCVSMSHACCGCWSSSTTTIPNDSSHKYDSYGRLKNYVAVIDATSFGTDTQMQYETKFMLRELNKAYSGFVNFRVKDDHDDRYGDATCLPNSVATGKWGCGAFKGDPKLKFLLQLMVCVQLKLNMQFHLFGNDKDLEDEVRDVIDHMKGFNVSNRMLWRFLTEYSGIRRDEESILKFIKKKLEQLDQ